MTELLCPCVSSLVPSQGELSFSPDTLLLAFIMPSQTHGNLLFDPLANFYPCLKTLL